MVLNKEKMSKSRFQELVCYERISQCTQSTELSKYEWKMMLSLCDPNNYAPISFSKHGYNTTDVEVLGSATIKNKDNK